MGLSLFTTRRSLYAFSLITLFSLFNNIKVAAQGTWVPIATTPTHYNAGVMILMTDGTVICKTSSGGGQGLRWDKLTPDIHGSYVNGTWSTIAPMNNDRLYFSSEVLKDGRLYVAGGEYGTGGDKGEVYNPLTNTWTACPSIITGLPGISDANSEILPDGKILQAIVSSGTRLNYIWDPATNTYTPTGNCLRTNNEASWVKLPDESIIFIDNYGTSAERYIPSTGTWFNEGGAGTVPVALYDPYGFEAGGGFLLPNGKVYFLGSKPTSAYYTPSGTSSTPGTWIAGPAVPGAVGAPDAASAMMVDGNILMALSPEPRAGDHFPDSTIFYEFDYRTNTYTPVGAPGIFGDTLIQPCYYTNMLCLPDGNILFCNQGDDQYYEYIPASAPLAAGKPTITSITENSCTNFTIIGTLFNGITEGACYGDDWQNFTNYPIVRLTSVATGNVTYGRTTNWNSTGVMRGTLADTAQFTIPSIPDGNYLVEVVANGNPSATFPLTTGRATITPASLTVCTGNTINLSTSIAGGTWSSNNTTLASVGSTTGIVSGNAAGTTTITYGLGTCTSTKAITILSSPAAITPAGATICVGETAALTDITPGGAWTSSATLTASVTGGLVTGISAGSTNISYTVAGCSATTTVNVNALPGTITGIKNVCAGLTTALSDAGVGVWTSGNTTVAIVNASTGVITGNVFGTSVITFTLPTGCTAMATVTVDLTAAPITGNTKICIGSSSALSDATLTGTWTSNNTSVAIIASFSGMLSSVGVGTATITYKIASGCSATTIVTVNPVPTTISGPSSVCVNASVSLSNSVTGGSWTSANTSVAIIDPVTGLSTGITAGTASLSYTLGGVCATGKIIRVDPLPASITGTFTVCEGSSANLTDATTGGTWGSSNTALATISSGTLTGVAAGTASITYTLSTGCTIDAPVTINPVPAAITGNPSLCIGLTTSLTDATTGGIWQSSNTSVATVSASGVVNGIIPGTATIIYSSLSGCSATRTVTVHTLPSAITGVASVCSGNASTFSNAVSGGVWTSSNTTIATAGYTSGLVSGVTVGTATITYSLGAGCEVSTPVAITSGATPIVGSLTTCPGFTTTLSNATPSGAWTSTNTAVATISGSGVVSGVSSGTSVISYTVGSGCAATAIVTIGATTAAPVAGLSSVCVGQFITLSDATTGGVWSSSNTSRATIGASTGIVSGIAAGTVTLTYKVTTVCGTASAMKVIMVNSLPAVGPISGLFNICLASTTTLSNATPSGVWSSSNTSVATVAGSGLVSGLSVGTAPVSYSVTNIAGCSATSSVLFAVNLPITATVTPASSTSFCTGGFVTLNATAGTGYSYQWKVGGLTLPGATNASYTSNYTGNFSVVINGPSICASASSAVAVAVNPAFIVTPSVSIGAAPGTTLCLVSSPVSFTPSAISGGSGPSYKWFVNGTLTSTSPTYGYTPASGDLVKCLLTSNATCAFPDTAVAAVTMTIAAPQTPSVSIVAAPGEKMCAGSLATFTATPVFGGAVPSYLWTKNSVPVGTGSSYAYLPVNGDQVSCTMTSTYSCLTSTTAVSNKVKMIIAAPSVNSVAIKVSKTSIASGQLDTFTAVAAHPGTTPTYQWYLNGIAIPGETSATYVTYTLENGDEVKCSVTSSDDCTSPNKVYSGGIKMKVGIGVLVKGLYSSVGGFTLVPNPNAGTFNIKGLLQNAADSKVALSVTNMLGQSVYAKALLADGGELNQTVTLPVGLANGTYLVSVTSGDQHVVFHMIIDK